MKKYNDYELLYLIAENNEFALEIMFEKYLNLISKRIDLFKIQNRFIEDFMQEGLITLNKAIYKFNDKYKKTFTRYFDELLQWRFMEILRREKEYFYNVNLVEDMHYLADENNFYKKDLEELVEWDEFYLSDFEKTVFDLKYRQLKKVADIAFETGSTLKMVYNATCRIKYKLKSLK